MADNKYDESSSEDETTDDPGGGGDGVMDLEDLGKVMHKMKAAKVSSKIWT